MKLFSHIAIGWLATISLSLASPVDTAPLENWLAEQAQIKTGEINITLEKYDSKGLLVTSQPCRAWVDRPEFFRWDIGSPVNKQIIRNPEGFMVIDQTAKSFQILSKESKLSQKYSILWQSIPDDIEHLNKYFNVVSSSQSGNVYTVTLQPNSSALRKSIPWIIVYLDRNANDLLAIEFHKKDKSSLRAHFRSSKHSSNLSETLFLPKLDGFNIKK